MNDLATNVETVDRACRQAAAGKLAARRIRGWLAGSDVGEAEFRLLWQLRQTSATTPFDQKALATALAVSPAQVSGAVERLRLRRLIETVAAGDDRRRQCWRLSDGGRRLVADVLRNVESPATAAGKEAA